MERGCFFLQLRSWLAGLSILALVFSSGCSLVLEKLADVQAEQKKKVADSKSTKTSEKEKKSEASKEEDPEQDGQLPENAQDGEGAALDDKEVSVNNFMVKTDDQNWKQADQDSTTAQDGMQINSTLITPEGVAEEQTDEIIVVTNFEKLDTNGNLGVFAKKYMSKLVKDGLWEANDWEIIEGTGDDVFAEVDSISKKAYGYTRFIEAKEGVYVLIYLNDRGLMDDADKEDWANRIKDSGEEGSGLTL